jgi:hypothetical protein
MKYCPQGCRFPDNELQFCVVHGLSLHNNQAAHDEGGDSTLILHHRMFAATENIAQTPAATRKQREPKPGLKSIAIPSLEMMVDEVCQLVANQLIQYKSFKSLYPAAPENAAAFGVGMNEHAVLIFPSKASWDETISVMAIELRVGQKVKTLLCFQPAVGVSKGKIEFGWQRRDSLVLERNSDVAHIATQLLLQAAVC